MTRNIVYAPSSRVGRTKRWKERIGLPLAEGTTARIDGLLKKGEFRLDFVRDAIEREIKRRSKGKPHITAKPE